LPHLPWQQRMAVERAAPLTHPHPHASHMSNDPIWRAHRAIGTIPHYQAVQEQPVPPLSHVAYTYDLAFSTTPCRPIAAERPLLGTGDGGYEHRCGRIDQGLGCCMSWGGSALGSTFVIVLLCGCITLMVPTSAVLAEGLWPVGGGCDGRGFGHAIDARS
jgi:hypothetical protein